MNDIKDWAKYTLFRQNYSHLERETIEALFSYMMRMLSRNRIPDKQLVDDILKGKEKVPECGYPGCHMGGDHVH